MRLSKETALCVDCWATYQEPLAVVRTGQARLRATIGTAPKLCTTCLARRPIVRVLGTASDLCAECYRTHIGA